jgi:predicted dehydrogenase
MRTVLLLFFCAALAFCEIRVGIVGTDTSHVIAFTKILNDPSNPDHAPGARIVAAYKGGSKDVESSYTRVDKYAEELKTKHGIEIVPDIATLCSKVDAILLESVDPRQHLAQFKEIVKSHKPVFIDKPLASTLEDAREIARIAKENHVAWFTSV